MVYIRRVLCMDQKILQTRSLSWCPRCSRRTRLIGFSYRASALRQLLAGAHLTPLGNIIHIPFQPVLHLHLNTACLVFKQKMLFHHLNFDGAQKHYLPNSRRTRYLLHRRCSLEVWRCINLMCDFFFFLNLSSATQTDLSLTDSQVIYQEYKVSAFHHFLFVFCFTLGA